MQPLCESLENTDTAKIDATEKLLAVNPNIRMYLFARDYALQRSDVSIVIGASFRVFGGYPDIVKSVKLCANHLWHEYNR